MKKALIILFAIIISLFGIQAKQYPHQYGYDKLRKEAMKGDAMCQYWMGKTFEEGRLSQTPDLSEAFVWYLKAARGGHGTAQEKVYTMYNAGRGVAQNDAEFIHWLRECANNPSNVYGDEAFVAKVNLAKFMCSGAHGVKKDIDAAISMLENVYGLSRTEINAIRYRTLGQLYKEKADKTFAPEYYKKAAEYYNREAKEWGEIPMANHDVKKLQDGMSQAYMSAANMWLMHETFSDTPDDYTNMLNAVKAAAQKGHSGGMYFLGEIYLNGEFGVEKDVKEAWHWLGKVYNLKPQASYIMADYCYGIRAYKDAYLYYTHLIGMKGVANEVLGEAYRKLAAMYRFGRGVEKDETKADEYTAKASRLGDPDAAKIQQWLNQKF